MSRRSEKARMANLSRHQLFWPPRGHKVLPTIAMFASVIWFSVSVYEAASHPVFSRGYLVEPLFYYWINSASAVVYAILVFVGASALELTIGFVRGRIKFDRFWRICFVWLVPPMVFLFIAVNWLGRAWE